MIEITIQEKIGVKGYREKKNSGKQNDRIFYHQMQIRGHAGYCPGNDILCAAVSALIHTFCAYIEDMKEMDGYHIDIGPGKADIRWWYDRVTDQSQKILGAYEGMIQGYRLLARTYPEYLYIAEDE